MHDKRTENTVVGVAYCIDEMRSREMTKYAREWID
jgi:hypothetical protein